MPYLLVCAVLCVPAGPGAAQQLVDTSKGYALLLKKGKEPLTAGLLDVYGRVSCAAQCVHTVSTQAQASLVQVAGSAHCACTTVAA